MDVPEQLCYIPCNFCSIVLAVSVPCNNLFDVVTVRCGHCSNVWGVNMAAAFQCLQPSWQDVQAAGHTSTEYKVDHLGSSSKWNNKMAIQPSITHKPEQRIVNRQRRFKELRPIIQRSATGKLSVLLQKIGHTSLTSISGLCWRPITKLLLMRGLGNIK